MQQAFLDDHNYALHCIEKHLVDIAIFRRHREGQGAGLKGISRKYPHLDPPHPLSQKKTVTRLPQTRMPQIRSKMVVVNIISLLTHTKILILWWYQISIHFIPISYLTATVASTCYLCHF